MDALLKDTNNEVIEASTENKSKKQELLDWVKFLLSVAIILWGANSTIGITKVSGHSMDPTLRDGSVLLINKLAATFTKPSYGDVVIIQEDGFQIVKRVIGIPGDTVTILDGTLYVNNVAIPEVYPLGQSFDIEPVTVPEGNIFVMGDNRTPGESLDSRDPSVGPLPERLVKGHAIISLFPFYKIMKPLEL